MKKTAYAVVVSLAITGGAFAQQKPQATPSADPVVITIGDTKVTKSEFEAAIESLPQQYQVYAKGPGKREFAEDFVKMKLLAGEAKRKGLDKTPEVARQLSLLRDNTLAQAELKSLLDSIQVSDAELQAAYDARKGDLEQAEAKHILIAFDGSPALPAGTKRTEEEAKKLASDLKAKIAAGADFAEIAKAQSDDKGSGARGGDLGSFGRGQMVPEFEQAAFSTPVGTVSDPIRTQFGFHIIKVESRGVAPLAEVREEIETELTQQKLNEKIDAMQQKTAPKFDDAYFAPPAPTAPPEGVSGQ